MLAIDQAGDIVRIDPREGAHGTTATAWLKGASAASHSGAFTVSSDGTLVAWVDEQRSVWLAGTDGNAAPRCIGVATSDASIHLASKDDRVALLSDGQVQLLSYDGGVTPLESDASIEAIALDAAGGVFALSETGEVLRWEVDTGQATGRWQVPIEAGRRVISVSTV